MTFLRSIISYARLGTLVGLIIGCPGVVNAISQELGVDRGSTAAPAVQSPGLTTQITDLIENSALAPDAMSAAYGMTLKALNQAINPLWTVPVASFSGIRERPIFSPSRRRAVNDIPASVEPGSSPVADQRPPLVLVGVVAGETDGIGIFLDPGTKSIVRLKTQESHAGWTLSGVRRREATLQRGGEIAVLEIPNP